MFKNKKADIGSYSSHSRALHLASASCQTVEIILAMQKII